MKDGSGSHALLWLGCIWALWAQPALGQSESSIDALKNEIRTLREGQAAIQTELREIKALLQPRAPEPTNIVLEVLGHPTKGEKVARVLIVEFSDYQCPFCARHHRDTLPQIQRSYVDAGKIKYVFRNFPIDTIHPQAFKAAAAAICAGEQGKYWEMHDRLFANQNALGPTSLMAHADALTLDRPRFELCLDGDASNAAIRDDVVAAQKAGVQGTPAFFIGIADPDAPTMKVLKTIVGAQPYAVFQAAVDELLRASGNR